VTITAEGRIREDAVAGPLKLNAELRYQACNNEVCLAPKKIPVAAEAEIVPQTGAAAGGASPRGAASGDAAYNSVAELIQSRGWVIALVAVFLGGLALNLTPCVYPMVAITVSYFGGRGGASFGRALVYCAGIVLTYSALGLAAALTGGLFGALLQSPAVIVGIAVLLVALALSMFGLYELQPPQFLVQKAAGLSSKAGYVGVFFLGATVGVIAAPCLAPILVALLAYVGQRGDPWVGWWLFFTLACGLGLPYAVLGAFSGMLARLPKSGHWMVWVKRAFGVVLIAVAGWFVLPLVKPTAGAASLIAWQSYAPELLAQPGKPVLIDFYADWCIPCHEMEKRTFRDPRVVEESKHFLMVKADLTRSDSPAVEKLARDFHIVGVPTLAFFASNGGELTQLRQIGFVPADKFLGLMREARVATPPTNAPSTAPAMDAPALLLAPF
jgi:thiol:disulfide interchange protein DsbD